MPQKEESHLFSEAERWECQNSGLITIGSGQDRQQIKWKVVLDEK